MRGHICKRGHTYSVVFDTGYENGKRKQKWMSGYKTKKDAEIELAEEITKIEKGIFFTPEKVTLKRYLVDWLHNSKQNLAIKTYRSYSEMIERYINPCLGYIILSKLKPKNIQNFYTECTDKKKLSGTTTLYCHRILHKALKTAVKWEMLYSNPCDSVIRPKRSKKEMTVLNNDQVKFVLSYLKKTTLYIPILLAVTTGMRRGEICGLKWANVSLDDKVIYITHQLQKNDLNELEIVPTKTKASNRKIVLLDFTIPILREYMKKQSDAKQSLGKNYKGDDYVICKYNGEPYNPDYITRHFARTMINLIKKSPNIPRITFHDLRHTHATLLLKAGIHPKVVSERLGHSQISITLDIYSHVLPDMQCEAADKLNQLFII